MRAVVIENGEPRLAEVPRPVRKDGEALVRVLSAGVCNTDIEILKGYMHFAGIPGHEFVGIVEECGNPHLLNKRVVGEINCACGACDYCMLEMPHHCLNRTVLGIAGRNGAFAEYLTLPEDNLHIVPGSIRDDVAVFTEPAAAAFRVLEQLQVTGNDRVIVLGDGKLGQLLAQVLWLHTKRLVCIGRHSWKLDLLRRLHIATALAGDPVQPGADIVVEATGSPEGLQRALELVRPEGTVVLKTTIARPVEWDLAAPVVNEVRLLGSRCGPFRPALEALTLGVVEVQPLISECYPIEQGLDALERATAPDVMKVIIHV